MVPHLCQKLRLLCPTKPPPPPPPLLGRGLHVSLKWPPKGFWPKGVLQRHLTAICALPKSVHTHHDLWHSPDGDDDDDDDDEDGDDDEDDGDDGDDGLCWSRGLYKEAPTE